ncbi:MAG: hypothetical protein WEA77_01750 [Hyphomonas sp.]|uniref:hypothetical protein n=1 Tax=Hyphomonas sp. TaxID=87 RepID=UPI00349FF4D8
MVRDPGAVIVNYEAGAPGPALIADGGRLRLTDELLSLALIAGIAASVAGAAEPEDSGAHELRIGSEPLWISGEETDRQIVLLGDPMARVIPYPPEPPELAELQRQIDIDVAEPTGPDVLGPDVLGPDVLGPDVLDPVIAWHESEDREEFAALGEKPGELHSGM